MRLMLFAVNCRCVGSNSSSNLAFTMMDSEMKYPISPLNCSFLENLKHSNINRTRAHLFVYFGSAPWWPVDIREQLLGVIFLLGSWGLGHHGGH